MNQICRSIISCNRCPRLRDYCKKVAQSKRRAYLKEEYWGKPITGFGDPRASLIIIGLAPAAHGANRTGRIFTGDRSGDWLFRALYRAGFANQSFSTHSNDGLKLKNAYVTCVVKCAPPDNKPNPLERQECQHYLENEITLLTHARVWMALGQIAFNAIWPIVSHEKKRPKFAHGIKIAVPGNQWLLTSYHPSQQNTFTGRLTENMFDSVFSEAKTLVNSS